MTDGQVMCAACGHEVSIPGEDQATLEEHVMAHRWRWCRWLGLADRTPVLVCGTCLDAPCQDWRPI